MSSEPDSPGAHRLGDGSLLGEAHDHAVRLLLIEDDIADALVVRELLSDSVLDVEITWVASFAAALPALAADPCCVLLDLGLPDAVGLSGLHRVLDVAPHTAVVVLTGLDDESGGLDAVAAGAQDYLIKGQVDGGLLARAIRYAIGRKQAEESLIQLREQVLLEEQNTRLERGLLPAPLVWDSSLQFLTRYRPGRWRALLGGDFFDAVQTQDGSVHVMIGDVCGHGPDEAALGVCLRIAWRTLVLAGYPADRMLAALDAVLVSERASGEIFATACMLSIAPSRTCATVRLAGHPAPIRISGSVQQLPEEPAGIALGVVPGATWPAISLELGTRWSLMLFTDGLVEGRDGEGPRRLGVPRLINEIQAIQQGAEGPVEDLVDRLIAAVEKLNGGAMADDLAIMCVAWSGDADPSVADGEGERR